MARFVNPATGQTSIIEESLNPDLVKGLVKVPDVGVITSDLLKQATPINFQTPQESSIFPVAGLNAKGESVLLPQEQQQSDIIKQTQALMDQISGKTTFQAQKETELGITELTKTQRDLETRLKGLQAESLAIPLQLQREFEGRGITAGGLAPIQAGELRKNAIQALSVSSLLEASRGNLTTALDLVDRAVAQKYDPIEARINANLKNLDLLSKDPTLMLAQKNRLEAQQAKQKAEADRVAQARKDEEESKKIAIQVALTGKADALTLDSIQKADPITASQIAAPFLQKVETGQTEFERAFFRERGRLPTFEEIKMNENKEPKNIFQEAQTTLQQYKDQGFSRQQVEDEWKKQNVANGQDFTTVELPLTVQRGLDVIYGPVPTIIPVKTKVWYNPFSWFQ
jgi:hypothetical protein